MYSDRDIFNSLSYEDTLNIENEITPLVLPYKDDYTAVRFDALMYAIELAYIIGEDNKKAKNDLLKRVNDVSSISNIPEIIRLGIRNLIKYIDKKAVKYTANFSDDV